MAEKSKLDFVKEIDHAKPFALLDFEAMGVIDSVNGPMLPTTIRVRTVDGGLREKKHYLMLLDNPRRHVAKQRARAWAVKEKWDLKEDSNVVDEMEDYERFAIIIRDEKAPHDQSYGRGVDLFQAFRSVGSLGEVKGTYDEWEKMNDPRYGELNAEQCWAVIHACYQEGTLRPLMLIGGLEQVSCIMLSARAALSSPMAPLSVRRPWIVDLENTASKESGLPPMTSSESLASNQSETA